MNRSKFQTDDLVIIEPSYYSDGIPVFHPTSKQFDNFYQFNKAINKYGMKSGIIKVIPPRKWLDLLAHNYSDDRINGIKIRNPIIQHIHGTSNGVYSQQNVERNRSYNIYQWKKMSESSAHQPPTSTSLSRSKRGNADHDHKHNNDKDHDNANHDNDGAYHSKLPVDGKKFNIDTSEFTSKRCQALEKVYWKSLTYTEPMYGADVLGSIFDDTITSWNVNHLPNVLDLMEEKVPGVNDAYLYAGLWKATFAWHLEDQDLYSINYIHFGAPKQWYLIPQNQETKFFELMKQIYDDEWRSCPEFLRHKTFLVSPQFLDKHGIKYNKVIHYQGEFIITYPYGYHAGFNYGYNLAESVNFALDDWFIIGEVANICQCIPDAVHININELRSKFYGTPCIPDDTDTDDDKEKEEVQQLNPKKRSTPDLKRLSLHKIQYETSAAEVRCGLVVFNDQQNFQLQLLNYPQLDKIESVPYRDVIVDDDWNYFWVKQRKLTLSLKMDRTIHK
ncbi:uncharacterized protein KQ657_000384 [Scheffersomyces spartinae]|uniref:Uncharacterized protein n=1 Tax=Scheffersomyces spartinae TaxID=45513 RepID=A0A9P7V9H6_9ASCO|nr:uncharacterized protein KQ657_000384 [Scheffersomyces spartinae]KAG7193697.1 hypothetical protein KQ657_000384 [Scheffersomyces spartinae]